MDAPLDQIVIPDYPNGSYNFIRRLRGEQPHQQDEQAYKRRKLDASPSDIVTPIAQVKLDIAIIGAGVGGLSNAIALKLSGHRVRVYEQAPALSEVGAGIQIPPNSSRILHGWGIREALSKRSVTPESILWRRWEDSSVLSCAKLNPEMEQQYGGPYYVTHRAHLHTVLHERTEELGVPLTLNKKVAGYDAENNTATFEDGEVISADLIIAADGFRSFARKTLNGESDRGPRPSGFSAYRAIVQMEDVKADPTTSWIAEKPITNMWVGRNIHLMSYHMAGGTQYNMVLVHATADSSTAEQNSPQMLEDVKRLMSGWDQSVTKLLDKITSLSLTPLNEIYPLPQKWFSPSGGLLITGDAAHAMVPYMAIGAAMAVEDAATLATSLAQITPPRPSATMQERHLHRETQLIRANQVYQDLRVHRTEMVGQCSRGYGLLMHLSDGDVQQARDRALRSEYEAMQQMHQDGDAAATAEVGWGSIETPNQWEDATVRKWCYTYDSVAVAEAAWEELRARDGRLQSGPGRKSAQVDTLARL